MDGPRQLLRQLEQRARRRFGQHFLTDERYPGEWSGARA